MAAPEQDSERPAGSESLKETPREGETQEAAIAAKATAALKKEIEQEFGGTDGSLKKTVEVKQSGSGILISLTDDEDFEMFGTGSAKPEPGLLKLVQAVAKVLQSRTGHIIVRGHTDSRPYRNKYYDNWQLSTARAHLARYMLISGGLPEQRIVRIEGVADRELRNKQDPQAAVNRRIEILLETAVP